MIERGETNFSETVYDRLNEHIGSAKIRVRARRRNLDFSVHSIFTSIEERWDASVAHNRLYRTFLNSLGNLYITWLENEDAGLQAWASAVLVATGVATGVAPSLFEDSSLFFKKGDYIARATSADGETWDVNDTWAAIPTGALDYLAASGGDTVHLALWGTDYNTNFQTIESGIPANSGIYIPHRVTGFSAVDGRLDEEFDDTEQIIVATLDLPVQIATRAVGARVDTVGLRSNGILSFIYRRGTWSDHFFVERFDDASWYQYRKAARVSKLPIGSGRWALVAYGKDGKETLSHDTLQYYFTANGKYWEHPQLFRTGDISSGGKLLVNGNFAYMLTTSALYRSYATELVSDTIPDAIVEDITSHISTLESSNSSGRQTALALRNEDSWFESSMMQQPGVYSLIIEQGIGQDLQQISHEIVEVATPNKQTPAKEVIVKSRDFMALLDTHVKAAHARIYDTQVVGGDEYNDITQTGYGGLSHTAGVLGSWSTRDGWLEVQPNNNSTLAYKTFKIDIWNGFIQAKINPRSEDRNQPDQWIGLCWRGYDKDNYYSFEYDIVADKLRLFEVRAATKTALASPTGTLGWALEVERYLRVRFHYSRVICEHSADGTAWTEAFNLVVPGKEIINFEQKVVFEEGQSGYVARGYAPEATWDYDPWEFEDDFVVDPYIVIGEEPAPPEETELPWGSSNPPPILNSNSPNMIAFSTNGYIYRTTNGQDASPSWAGKAVFAAWPNYRVDYFEFDPGSPAFLGTGTSVNALIFGTSVTLEQTYGVILYVRDLFADNPDDISTETVYDCGSLALRPVSLYPISPPVTDYGTKICASLLVKNHFAASYRAWSGTHQRVVFTEGGSAWTEVNAGDDESAHNALAMSNVYPGTVYSARRINSSPTQSFARVSADKGKTWQDLSGFGPLALSHTAYYYYAMGLALTVPLNNNEGDNIHYFTRVEKEGEGSNTLRFIRGNGSSEQELLPGGYRQAPFSQRGLGVSPLNRDHLAAYTAKIVQVIGGGYMLTNLRLHTSIDGGSTFVERAAGVDYPGVFFCSDDENSFYLGGAYNKLKLTRDMGATFEDKTGNMPASYQSHRIIGVLSKPT